MGRFLRSKVHRALLWLAAKGKCQDCGRDLPTDWHADHAVPWVLTGRTNVHEMRALCPDCNTRKGAKLMAGLFDGPFRMRTHQAEALQLCRDIRSGKSLRRVIAAVTPGGGKSALPVILAAELIRPGLADKICWVAPRRALLQQAERAFLDEYWRRALCHAHTIRANVNELNPCRDLSGYVTTVQAIGEDRAGITLAELQRHRYILVLDEVHHVHVGGEWERAVRPLAEAAWLTVCMTGSTTRHDGKRIFGLPYGPDNRVAIDGTHDAAVIRYTRQDALRERAVIALHIEHHDGRADWVDRDGERQSVGSFEEAGEAVGDALFTALRTDYAYSLLDLALTDWFAHRARVNRRSKLLVVAADIASARLYLKAIHDRGYEAGIATSDDADALKVIDRFRRTTDRPLDVLVTVAMAYEGLDVPPITHIALLTHVRSYPWIEQVLARGTRFDKEAGPWEEQVCRVFVPDDPLMQEILRKIQDEQQEAVRDLRQKAAGDGGGEAPSPTPPPGRIVPEASRLTRGRLTDLNAGDEVGHEETEGILRAMEAEGVRGLITPLQLRRVLVRAGFVAAAPGSVRDDGASPLLTPSEMEKNLRESIERFARANDRQRGWDFGTTNRLMRAHMSKPRGEMTLAELQAAWAWLNRQYGQEASS